MRANSLALNAFIKQSSAVIKIRMSLDIWMESCGERVEASALSGAGEGGGETNRKDDVMVHCEWHKESPRLLASAGT